MKILLIGIGVVAVFTWRLLLMPGNMGYSGPGMVLPKTWRTRLAKFFGTAAY